jgi:uncharacterized membrane protein YqjE
MASADSATSSGMMDSIRSFLASWVAVIKTRVEIISVEIEEQREWMEQLLLLAVGAAFCLSMGMILLTLLIVVLFWENHPLVVLGGFTILYLGGGIVLWLTLREKIRSKPRIFSATSSELGKDYTALQPRTP